MNSSRLLAIVACVAFLGFAERCATRCGAASKEALNGKNLRWSAGSGLYQSGKIANDPARNDHWRPEVQRLLKEYFPKHTGVVIEQFRKAGLYPRAGETSVD